MRPAAFAILGRADLSYWRESDWIAVGGIGGPPDRGGSDPRYISEYRGRSEIAGIRFSIAG